MNNWEKNASLQKICAIVPQFYSCSRIPFMDLALWFKDDGVKRGETSERR